jgi:ABC-type polysaccharide/polyol phosphate export permease
MTTTERGFELRGPTTPIPQLVVGLVRSRSLVRMLARRDFYTRYRRPTLGVLWAVGLPLVQAGVMAVVFTKIVRVRTPIPYIVFVLAGMVPWTFLSATLTTAVRSITSGSSIASKVYFPRSVLPLSNVGTSFYGFVPALGVMIAVAFAYGLPLRPRLLLLLPAMLAMVVLTASMSLVLAALQVYFRDVAYITNAALQPWLYASAVIFPVRIVPEGLLRSLVVANPATGMIELFRDAFTGLQSYTGTAVLWTVAWSAAFCILAALLYRRYDRVFVDLL